MKNPTNKTIALLVALNILAFTFIMYGINKPTSNGNTVYANELDVSEQTQVAPKQDKEEILFSINSVTKNDDVGSIPLYFSHSNEEGTFFTYLETEQPNTWNEGYWFIDYDTLNLANINANQLMHNDVIQGVFYANNDEGYDHFEIKEVIALSNEYIK